MKAAGDAILFQLKSLGEAQAEMLARRLGISVQAVRQRRERLLTENLVAFSDHAHGRGRPPRLWSLAPGTASLFPDTHAELTVDLIGTIGEAVPVFAEPAHAPLGPGLARCHLCSGPVQQARDLPIRHPPDQ